MEKVLFLLEISPTALDFFTLHIVHNASLPIISFLFSSLTHKPYFTFKLFQPTFSSSPVSCIVSAFVLLFSGHSFDAIEKGICPLPSFNDVWSYSITKLTTKLCHNHLENTLLIFRKWTSCLLPILFFSYYSPFPLSSLSCSRFLFLSFPPSLYTYPSLSLFLWFPISFFPVVFVFFFRFSGRKRSNRLSM